MQIHGPYLTFFENGIELGRRKVFNVSRKGQLQCGQQYDRVSVFRADLIPDKRFFYIFQILMNEGGFTLTGLGFDYDNLF